VVNYEGTACLQDFFYTEVVFQAYYSKLEWMNNMVKSLYYFGFKRLCNVCLFEGDISKISISVLRFEPDYVFLPLCFHFTLIPVKERLAPYLNIDTIQRACGRQV